MHGDPVVNLFPYRTSKKINGSRQYNTIVHCRVQLVVQHIYVPTRTKSRVIDLFGIASSQESNDDPLPPPPPSRKRKHKRRQAAQDTASKRSPRRSITSEEYKREEEGSAAEGDEHEAYHRGYL